MSSAMTLAEFTAIHKRSLLDDLLKGSPPSVGTFDEDALKEARARAKAPQMGQSRFEPEAIHLEFIFQDPLSSALVFTVTLTPPERIVFMPVPSWVIENIWQGDVAGSYHFESDAAALMRTFADSLAPKANEALFLGSGPKRRE